MKDFYWKDARGMVFWSLFAILGGIAIAYIPQMAGMSAPAVTSDLFQQKMMAYTYGIRTASVVLVSGGVASLCFAMAALIVKSIRK